MVLPITIYLPRDPFSHRFINSYIRGFLTWAPSDTISNTWHTRPPHEELRIFSPSSESLPRTNSQLSSSAHAAGVLFRGLDQPDYLLTTSRTTSNIPLPDPLSRSPTLICLNEPGLIVLQKYQATIWTREGKPDILSGQGLERNGYSWRTVAEPGSLVRWADLRGFIANKRGFSKEVWMSQNSLILLKNNLKDSYEEVNRAQG